MVRDADRLGGSITARRDARVTKVGWFLRATKLDELPQFLNLLVGDLTLIGPRPEVPGIVERFTSEQRRILNVRPGITGPGQIYYTTDQADKIPDDVEEEHFYINHLLYGEISTALAYT
jgi:lipopolysaccharide/colanic/teichoic acid biosynthesis glycosyltransferase